MAEGVLLSSVLQAGGEGSVSGGAGSGRLAAPDCVAISVRTSGNGLGGVTTAGAVEELRWVVQCVCNAIGPEGLWELHLLPCESDTTSHSPPRLFTYGVWTC